LPEARGQRLHQGAQAVGVVVAVVVLVFLVAFVLVLVFILFGLECADEGSC
jgi:hypothetical protein